MNERPWTKKELRIMALNSYDIKKEIPKSLLDEMLQYIEDTEVSEKNKSLEELINDIKMPELYYKIIKEIYR